MIPSDSAQSLQKDLQIHRHSVQPLFCKDQAKWEQDAGDGDHVHFGHQILRDGAPVHENAATVVSRSYRKKCTHLSFLNVLGTSDRRIIEPPNNIKDPAA